MMFSRDNHLTVPIALVKKGEIYEGEFAAEDSTHLALEMEYWEWKREDGRWKWNCDLQTDNWQLTTENWKLKIAN